MAAILNFRKNCKTQKCLYLENRARQSDFDEIFDPQGIRSQDLGIVLLSRCYG